MNIYDEAIEELQNYIGEYGMDYYDTKHYPITTKALERAKRVEELLRLYELKDEMEKQFGYDYPYENIWKQINAIKEELK